MLLFAVGAAVYYFANQKTVPYVCDGNLSEYSGEMCRKQLRTMKPDAEMQLGLQSYQQILQDNAPNLVRSGPVKDAVEEIGIRIARAASDTDPGFDWAFNVIESEQANAFALPGGYTAVYTGLIPIAENEDGLAVVMGHEVAHALAHHGAERMAQQNSSVLSARAYHSGRAVWIWAHSARLWVFLAALANMVLLCHSHANMNPKPITSGLS